MYYFIVNPNSGCGRGSIIWEKMEKFLKARQVDYETFLTQQPGDARDFARELTEGLKEARTLVAVGGDGTVNEILDGLSFSGLITLGFIPTGSGNDLARSLKLPKNPRRCLKKILNPKFHKVMDYGVLSYGEGEVSHRRFAVSAGMGMDAAVCQDILRAKYKGFSRLRPFRKFSYLLVGVKQLILAKPSKGYILLNGIRRVEFRHVWFISAHIHPFEGGGFRFAPEADCEDGKLSVCVMNHRRKGKLLPVLLYSLIKRNYLYQGGRCYTCEEAVIHMERPMAVHVDGESCFIQSDVQIRCIGRKLRMIV